MESAPAERKALLFTAGGVRLALRLSQVREILSCPDAAGEVSYRGAFLPGVLVSVALGLPTAPSHFALVTEGSPPRALRVEAVHGIVDLSSGEVVQLPARTLLPQPPPFQAALVTGGEIALELVVPAIGWDPIEPAAELVGPPPELLFSSGPELLFARGGTCYAVPIGLLAQVLARPAVHSVPLTPTAHRGLLYHGRAVHPVFDVPVLYGERALPSGPTALLVDAGGDAIAVLADRILPAGDAAGRDARRPSWDLLFAAA